MTRGTDKDLKTLTPKMLEDINKGRVKAKLEPIKIAVKQCLTCHKDFKSEGKHNRICNNCRSKNDLAGTMPETEMQGEL